MSPERWQQIEPILDEALALPVHERSLFLQHACNGDASLQAEIETFLIAKSRASDFLEQPVFALPSDIKQAGVTTQPNTHSAVATSPLVGQHLGSYKIVSLLGKGGMGEVYLARDTRLDREVAIKLLPPLLARDPERAERFKREARLQARLNNHQNIALIHALEQSDDTSFLVLEYVPGDTLADRLQHGALSVAEALPLFRQIADALATAHQQGIIHRDLKPANIKITPNGQIKVLDFGLAKLLHHEAPTAEAAEALLTTRTYWTTDRQVIIGTVPYMSPEQTYGQELDHRTDIWAFGCVLHESLTGQRPFAGFDTFDLFNAIRTREPDWSVLPADTPAPVRKLLQQCLQKEPNARLASASEAQQVLAEEEKTQPARLVVVLKRWKKQVALALAASLALTFGITYRQPLRAQMDKMMAALTPIPRDKALVVLPFKEAGNQAKEDKVGRGFAQSLQEVLANARDLRVMSFAQVAQANLANADAARLRQTLGGNLFLEGEVQRDGNRVTINFWIENLQARRVFSDKVEGQSNAYGQLQAEIARKVAQALNAGLIVPPTQAAKESDEQFMLMLNALQSDLTRETIKPVIESLEALRKDENNSARVLAALARAYFYQAQENDDEKAAQEAMKLAEQAVRSDPQATAAQIVSGQAMLFLGKHNEAAAAFRTVLNRQPANYDALIGLAWAYDDAKQWKEAEGFYRSAVTHWPNYWGSHNELGAFFFSQRRYEQARDEWLRVIQLNPDGMKGWINVGHAYFKLGAYAQAENHYREAVNKSTENQQTTEDAYIGWGAAQFYQANYEDAEKSFSAGLEWNKKTPLLWGNLGDALRYRYSIGKEQEIFDTYTEAIRLTEKQPRDSFTYARLAEYYAKRSKVPTAHIGQASADKERSLQFLRLALREETPSVEILFSAILVYHLVGDDKYALQYVEKALQQGLSHLELEREPDLRELRFLPTYDEIIKQAQSSPAK
ncbi:MAG TPA: protein kinase [Blastocatellia bacterium]|nr:protein kinase [Blastocatellia bacterium]